MEFLVAQWLGQYTGNTHATRVAELDSQLRHAISVLRAIEDDSDRMKRAKSVRKLAKRLLAARARCIKAKLASAEIHDAIGKGLGDVASLRQHLASIEEGGLDAILAEFGVAEELGRAMGNAG
jgi:hypothetical protein